MKSIIEALALLQVVAGLCAGCFDKDGSVVFGVGAARCKDTQGDCTGRNGGKDSFEHFHKMPPNIVKINDAEQIVHSAVKLSIPPPPKNIQLVNLPKICRRFCGK